jgi:hypothetical protein
MRPSFDELREKARTRKKKRSAKSKRIGTHRKVEAIKVYPDGREVFNLRTVEGQALYRRRVYEMAIRQDFVCGICKKGELLNAYSATFEHEDGRGMNGGHRDDRIMKDGKPYNCAAHSWCNVKKGSKRGY